MSKFCEDELIWSKYFPKSSTSQDQDVLRLKVFEWYEDGYSAPQGSRLPSQELTLNSVAAVLVRDQDDTIACRLRVISAPFNAEFISQLPALKRLFQHYNFPSAVLSELLASITNSFGTTPVDSETGVSVTWSHFLCKDIPVRLNGEDDEVNLDDNRQLLGNHYPQNWRLKVCYFVIHTREAQGKPKCVTLLCFGAPRTIIDRFRRLLGNKAWRDAVEDRFVILNIIYEELYYIVNKLSWQLAVMFRPLETATLSLAKSSDSVDQTTINFTNMHNISKHCIYMVEAVDAAIMTLDDMVSYLSRTRPASDNMITALIYRRSTFKSTQLRLRSLEKRMANIISLSFNLVTQQDSRVMQNDSSAMKVIAVMTLIFLPATGVGSIFSMPFFNVDFEGPSERMLEVAPSFWIFWVVTLPVTAIIILAWYWIYHISRARRSGVKMKRWSLPHWSSPDSASISESKTTEFPSKIHRAAPSRP